MTQDVNEMTDFRMKFRKKGLFSLFFFKIHNSRTHIFLYVYTTYTQLVHMSFSGSKYITHVIHMLKVVYTCVMYKIPLWFGGSMGQSSSFLSLLFGEEELSNTDPQSGDYNQDERMRALRNLENFGTDEETTAASTTEPTPEPEMDDFGDVSDSTKIILGAVAFTVILLFAMKDVLLKYVFPPKPFEEEEEIDDVAEKDRDSDKDSEEEQSEEED